MTIDISQLLSVAEALTAAYETPIEPSAPLHVGQYL